MTHWTRRQFGLWSTAALVLPAAALAEEPAQQAAGFEPSGLDSVVVTAKWESADPHKVTYALIATSPAAQSVRYDLGQAKLNNGKDPLFGLAWLNENHPFSRRDMAPDMVDLPAKKTLVIGHLHLNLPEAERTTALKFEAELIFVQAIGERTRTVQLPPLSVMKPDKGT